MAELYGETAKAAMKLSRTSTGRVLLLPSPIEVREVTHIDNSSLLRGKGYPNYSEIIESKTGLSIVHNGYVGIDTETSPLKDIEAQAGKLPIGDLEQLVASLKERLENPTDFEPGE